MTTCPNCSGNITLKNGKTVKYEELANDEYRQLKDATLDSLSRLEIESNPTKYPSPGDFYQMERLHPGLMTEQEFYNNARNIASSKLEKSTEFASPEDQRKIDRIKRMRKFCPVDGDPNKPYDNRRDGANYDDLNEESKKIVNEAIKDGDNLFGSPLYTATKQQIAQKEKAADDNYHSQVESAADRSLMPTVTLDDVYNAVGDTPRSTVDIVKEAISISPESFEERSRRVGGYAFSNMSSGIGKQLKTLAAEGKIDKIDVNGRQMYSKKTTCHECGRSATWNTIGKTGSFFWICDNENCGSSGMLM